MEGGRRGTRFTFSSGNGEVLFCFPFSTRTHMTFSLWSQRLMFAKFDAEGRRHYAPQMTRRRSLGGGAAIYEAAMWLVWLVFFFVVPFFIQISHVLLFFRGHSGPGYWTTKVAGMGAPDSSLLRRWSRSSWRPPACCSGVAAAPRPCQRRSPRRPLIWACSPSCWPPPRAWAWTRVRGRKLRRARPWRSCCGRRRACSTVVLARRRRVAGASVVVAATSPPPALAPLRDANGRAGHGRPPAASRRTQTAAGMRLRTMSYIAAWLRRLVASVAPRPRDAPAAATSTRRP